MRISCSDKGLNSLDRVKGETTYPLPSRSKNSFNQILSLLEAEI